MQHLTPIGPSLAQIWEKGFEKTTWAANNLFAILTSAKKGRNGRLRAYRKKKQHKKFQSVKIFRVLLAI